MEASGHRVAEQGIIFRIALRLPRSAGLSWRAKDVRSLGRGGTARVLTR